MGTCSISEPEKTDQPQPGRGALLTSIIGHPNRPFESRELLRFPFPSDRLAIYGFCLLA